MKKLFIILGLISSVIAVVLSILPLYKFAFIFAIIAFITGILAFVKVKAEGATKHTVQLIFLLTIIALGIATYQSITNTDEIGDTEQLEQREEDSLEDSIDELEDIEITD